MPPFIKIIFVTSFFVFSEEFSFKSICTICKICNHISFFLDILYQIRRVSLEDKSYMYCLWIAKDSEDCTAASRLGTLTLANSNAETIDDSLGEVRIQIIIH